MRTKKQQTKVEGTVGRTGGFQFATVQAFLRGRPSSRQAEDSATFLKTVNRHKDSKGFPCFFFSCKANARVKPAKTGHGPNSSYLRKRNQNAFRN